jgi:protoheme IX farnesyltransferase
MFKTYVLLTKPGIIAGNLITTIGGFALASHGTINYFLFLITLLGLGLVIASACVWNNFLDRKIDARMKRTRNRALVQGTISDTAARSFGTILGFLGALLLALYTPWITFAVACLGFCIYTFVYTFWKKSSRYATFVGSLAGAVPIVVGYCAVTGSLDLGAFLLFLLMVLWQMPHFFAIALYRLPDYTAAAMPVLPVVRGVSTTKVRMLIYVTAFACTVPWLAFFGYAGSIYLVAMSILGLTWFILSLRGFKKNISDAKWARSMFMFSLVVVLAQSACISLK